MTAKIAYTAQRCLIDGHEEGEEYIWEIDIQDFPRNIQANNQQVTSFDGSLIEVVHQNFITEYDIKFAPSFDASQWDEFYYSVGDGTPFTITVNAKIYNFVTYTSPSLTENRCKYEVWSIRARLLGKPFVIPPPVITVNPDNIYHIVGDTYLDNGVTATDSIDGNLTSSIVRTGSLDINTLGIYTYNYTVTNSEGLVGTAIRTIQIVNGPLTNSLTAMTNSLVIQTNTI